MDMKSAFLDTLKLAYDRDYHRASFDQNGVNYDHLLSMLYRIQQEPWNFSEAKLGRWLGYAQGVLVANGCLTLDECKEINKRHVGE